MSYALSQKSTFQRSGLLGIVVAVHVGVLLLVLAAKTIAPQIMEMPLIVDLLPAPEIEAPPEAKPLPVAAPTPVKPQPRPRPQPKEKPAPVLETTQSTAPAEHAPVAPPVIETPPPPPAPPAVTQARFDADYLRNPAPPYPPASRRFGEEGKVILRVRVSPEGSAEQVEIKTSSGSPRLDDSAQRTVRTWKFIPAKRGGAPVESWVLVPIHFKLEQ